MKGQDKTIKQMLAMTATLLCITSCSYIPGMNRLGGETGVFRDRQGDYIEAETIPRTTVPAQYDSYIIDDLYVIPELRSTETVAYLQAPRPRPLQGRSDREVVIQTMRDNSWIVVDASPSQVWPRIRDYWTAKGVPLSVENPTRGVMETGWFNLEENLLSMERIKVTVEPGFQDDSAEIRLQHLSQPQALPALEQVNWPDESSDKEVADEFLRDLSEYLADVANLYQASTVSFLAGNIPSDGKASLVRTPAGRELMRLNAGYERSWAAVGRALKRAGVDIVAESQEQGIFEVSYTIEDDEEEPGFFGKLISFDSLRGSEEVRPYSLRVRVLNTENVVEILVEKLGEEGMQGEREEVEDPVASLLQTIMAFIA